MCARVFGSQAELDLHAGGAYWRGVLQVLFQKSNLFLLDSDGLFLIMGIQLIGAF